MQFPLFAAITILLASSGLAQNQPWITFEGLKGPGAGKHVVFLSGDEEYRSEEALPQLAQIMATRHGFKCTVLFAINPATGEIDPNNKNNIPGMEALATADLAVMMLRFRELPDTSMKYFADYLNAGKPIVAIRTSTHAFQYTQNKQSPFAKYGGTGPEWPGGFGRQVLGETWVSHWGAHKKEATLGVIEPSAKDHPILRGVEQVFGDTDVYEAAPPADAKILMRGQVLKGMQPTDAPADYMKKTKGGEVPVNDPMQPILWTRNWTGDEGKASKIVTTTMGSATDLQSEGFRRVLVNAACWALGIEVPAKTDVALVGDYKASPYASDGARKGVKPADLALPASPK